MKNRYITIILLIVFTIGLVWYAFNFINVWLAWGVAFVALVIANNYVIHKQFKNEKDN